MWAHMQATFPGTLNILYLNEQAFSEAVAS